VLAAHVARWRVRSGWPARRGWRRSSTAATKLLEDDDQSPSEIITERPPAGLQVPRDLQFQKKRQFHPWDDGKQAGSDRQSLSLTAQRHRMMRIVSGTVVMFSCPRETEIAMEESLTLHVDALSPCWAATRHA
jgi:hypothetical protein